MCTPGSDVQSRRINSLEIKITDVKANAAVPPIAGARRRSHGDVCHPFSSRTQKLAQGVWLIGGGSHNSVAVEFKDFVTVIEAPLDEERSLAVIDAVQQARAEQSDSIRREHPPPFRPLGRPADLRLAGRDRRWLRSESGVLSHA